MFPSYRNQSVDLLVYDDWMTGFYMVGTLIVKGLTKLYNIRIEERIIILPYPCENRTRSTDDKIPNTNCYTTLH